MGAVFNQIQVAHSLGIKSDRGLQRLRMFPIVPDRSQGCSRADNLWPKLPKSNFISEFTCGFGSVIAREQAAPEKARQVRVTGSAPVSWYRYNPIRPHRSLAGSFRPGNPNVFSATYRFLGGRNQYHSRNRGFHLPQKEIRIARGAEGVFTSSFLAVPRGIWGIVIVSTGKIRCGDR